MRVVGIISAFALICFSIIFFTWKYINLIYFLVFFIVLIYWYQILKIHEKKLFSIYFQEKNYFKKHHTSQYQISSSTVKNILQQPLLLTITFHFFRWSSNRYRYNEFDLGLIFTSLVTLESLMLGVASNNHDLAIKIFHKQMGPSKLRTTNI